MHPVENIRGTASGHLLGRRIVLGVTGSIAAVKTVELARELVRHGAEVHAVMTGAAMGIITPDALQFGTGNPVVTKLTGDVEHVALLGDVPGKADLLLIAPATANTVSKMALGIDDSPVTTCATVAVGTGTPIVVAPAMHDAMMQHPIVAEHITTLRERLGVTWVAPKHEEKKAKLADIDAIVEAVIHRLANEHGGPLAGKRCLVVGGATAEPVDPVRVMTNRSSGKSALILATELRRLGADVVLWYGHATEPVPGHLADATLRFHTHQELMDLAVDAVGFDEIWMPAAINDYAPEPRAEKIGSEHDGLVLSMKPLPKVIEAVRAAAPNAVLVAFKAESNPAILESKARDRLARYGAQFVVGNTSAAFGADDTEALLIDAARTRPFSGTKQEVLAAIARAVAEAGRTVQH